MMYLLDTHVLLWLVSLQEKLTKNVKDVLHSSKANLYVSSISAFEIALKVNKGKLQLPLPAGEWFQKALQLHGIDEITINSEILFKSASLPEIHNDPADRIIIATAILNNATLISKDKIIAQYPDIKLLWV